ncbi:hypothetical protein GQ44DRAFT_36097 [Phaeosphaeriaceae sp. PMI808]|nr:hypothetical protein GQ44DRAFT_36097 [Phaeosphaeriaceae sp. PMI808]
MHFLDLYLGDRTGGLRWRATPGSWEHAREVCLNEGQKTGFGTRTGGLLKRGSEDRIWEHAREEHLGGGSWRRDLGARTGGTLRRWKLEKGDALPGSGVTHGRLA